MIICPGVTFISRNEARCIAIAFLNSHVPSPGEIFIRSSCLSVITRLISLAHVANGKLPGSVLFDDKSDLYPVFFFAVISGTSYFTGFILATPEISDT